MDERAYQLHWENDKKAKALYQTLIEIYGNELPKHNLFFKARFDKVITDDEHRLLTEFII